jgi:hypothetical protein
MVSIRPTLAVVLALCGLASLQANAAETSRVFQLAIPRPASPQQSAYLSVEVGVIAKGTEIDITIPSGVLIGTVSPFAIRPGQPAGTYVFPLSPDMIRNGRMIVQLAVRRAGAPTRAPTADEVPKVTVELR